MFMQRETGKPLGEKRRIVAYRDSLQAEVNALRERTPTVPAYFAGRDTSPVGATPSGVLREGRRGLLSAHGFESG